MPRKRYIVGVREVWEQAKEVDADSPEDAIRLVAQGHGECIENAFEYSHDRPSEEWTVEEKVDYEGHCPCQPR